MTTDGAGFTVMTMVTATARAGCVAGRGCARGSRVRRVLLEAIDGHGLGFGDMTVPSSFLATTVSQRSLPPRPTS